MKQYLATILISILGLVVFFTLIAAVSITLAGTQLAIGTSHTSAGRWALLPTIAISSGVLIAILTFNREKNKLETERARKKSKVFVERAAVAFDTTISLLRDRNNSRIVWVRAARTLRRAVDLGEHISDPDYKHAYELEVERARSELYDVLTLEHSATGERTPLPPQFFYGIDEWNNPDRTLDEAAIEAGHKINAALQQNLWAYSGSGRAPRA